MASSSNTESSKIADVLVALEDCLSCPVCLDQLTPPVMMCKSGHNTCSKCKTGCAQCPVCREPFIQTPNRTLDRILQLLPRPCRYASEGCPQNSASDDHKVEFCAFRSIKCTLGPRSSCLWTGTVKDWLNHALENHKNHEIKIGCTTRITFRYLSWLWFNPMGYKITINDSHFILTIKEKLGVFSLSLEHVSLQKPSEDFFFQISLQDVKGQIMNRTTLKPSVFTDIQNGADCMRMDVLTSDLETILNEKNKCSIFIFVTSKDI